MNTRRRFIIAASTASIVVVAAAPTFHRTRPNVRCDIPVRDYQHHKYSQPLRSISNVPVLIDVPLSTMLNRDSIIRLGSATPEKLRVKSFQFVKDPTLQIDHCSISEMSVLLHESGRWTISLRANQNPLNANRILDVTTLEPRQLFTDHLQRNQFHVIAHCYAQFGPSERSPLLGKPLLIPLTVKPFWVQRQQPYPLFETDNHPDIQRYFDSIDRVEIEFKYQLD